MVKYDINERGQASEKDRASVLVLLQQRNHSMWRGVYLVKYCKFSPLRRLKTTLVIVEHHPNNNPSLCPVSHTHTHTHAATRSADEDVNIWFLLRVNSVYSADTNELKVPCEAEKVPV